MNETNITVIGNVLTAPEWRMTAASKRKLTTFKIASTARRLDRESGKWVDGNSLRVRVNCWRGLADGVASSIALGDPVIVHGRLYTRDWVDATGMHRTLYEMEALSVGHDYARGRAKFARNRPATATSANEPEDEVRAGGEETTDLPDERTGLAPDDPLNDTDGDPAFADPLETLRASGFELDPVGAYLGEAVRRGGEDEDDGVDDDEADDHILDTAGGRRREPVAA